MKNVCLVLLLTGSVLAYQSGYADLYRWVDKNGNVSYQDRPPPADASQVEEKHFGNDAAPAEDDAAADAASKHPVTLYTVPQCSPCDDARNYLKQRNVPFKEVNVATDPKAQQAMRKVVGDLSVPSITVGTKIMKGFMESLLSGELDDAGYPKMTKPGEASPEGSSPDSQQQ